MTSKEESGSAIALQRIIRENDERIPRTRRRDVRQRRFRRLGIQLRPLTRPLDRPGIANRRNDIVERIQSASFDRASQRRRLFRRRPLDRINQRQRRFPFRKIVTDILPKRPRIRHIIEHVVSNLKRKPEIHPVIRKRTLLQIRHTREQRPELRRRRNKTAVLRSMTRR